MNNDWLERISNGGEGPVSTLPRVLLLPRYLIHSALYYRFDYSIIPDSEYDALALRLKLEWDHIEHMHKHLVERDSLGASGYYIQFPLIVLNIAKQIKEYTQHRSKITMAINARSKGQRGEREIIDLLQPHVNEVSDYNQVPRPHLQRNTIQSDKGGYDIVGLPGFALEVKRVENDTPGAIQSWWQQCVRQAKAGEEPVLLYRRNQRDWTVMLFTRLDLDEKRRYKVPSKISLEHFIFYMKSRLHCHQMSTK